MSSEEIDSVLDSLNEDIADPQVSPVTPHDAPTKPTLSNGALIGIVVGVGLAAVLVVISFLTPRYIRRHLPSHQRRRAGGPYYLF